MGGSELDSKGTMKEGKKAARADSKREFRNHLISPLFLLVIVFLFAGLVYSGSDDALFIDEAGNLKLQKGEPVNEFSNDAKLEGNSDRAVPTEKAVKTYVDKKDKDVWEEIDRKDKDVRADIEEKLQQNNKKVVESVRNHLSFYECGGRYLCTPRDCLAKCISLKMRMATYSEVYAWASGGKDHCAYMWMLHPEKEVVKVFPMYSNQTKGGCGGLSTGNYPRMIWDKPRGWDSKEKANCACSSLE